MGHLRKRALRLLICLRTTFLSYRAAVQRLLAYIILASAFGVAFGVSSTRPHRDGRVQRVYDGLLGYEGMQSGVSAGHLHPLSLSP